MPDSIVNAYEESDVLDPRTDAERPSVPPVIKPVDLGPVHVETPVVLSPMAGVTNWPFRVICESYGPDGLYVAEMITARALVARNPKALRLCRFAPSEKIRSLQLYGVNPSIVEQAAKIVIDENMADHVDLNFGCPVPKVTRRGGGSALPWKAQKLAADLRQNEWMIDYDEAGAIGRRYRREDEIGTPLCVTVDFDTLDDQAVTIRERDTMQQERVSLDKVADYIAERIGEKRVSVPQMPVEMGGEAWPESVKIAEAGGLY